MTGHETGISRLGMGALGDVILQVNRRKVHKMANMLRCGKLKQKSPAHILSEAL
jgi:hypothetical protein